MSRPKRQQPNSPDRLKGAANAGAAEPSFPSEEILRQAVAALLTRLPGVHGVQILHGSHECGKDVIFYLPGVVENILCACVIKNSRITGNVASSVGARTVYFQVEQAFDTPIELANGHPCSVERVYVVTPFPLSPSAIKSISGKLRHRSGNIIFLDGVKLFDLFRRYWPEYISHEALFVEQFLKHSTETLRRDQGLLGVAFQYGLGDADHMFSKVYVQPRFTSRLFQFELGHLFASPLIDESNPLHALTQRGRREITIRLEAMARATEQLSSWRLIDKEIADKALSILSDTLNFFRGPIATERPGGSKSDVYDLGLHPWASCRVIQKSRTSQSALDATFRGLVQLVRQANESLQHKPPHSISDLASPELRYAGRLNDFSQAAPAGCLAAREDSPTVITFDSNILNERISSILIVAGPGYGKSSFCRWHALMDSERYTTGQSDILPVYIALNTLAQGPVGSFENTFLKGVGRSALALADSPSWHANNRRVRLYLDGLDEIPYEGRRRELIDLLKHGLHTYPHIQAIITARDYIVTSWLGWMPRISLSEFDDPQIDELVSRWLTDSIRTPDGFRLELGRLPSLKPLLRVPLLATLVILVYKQTGRLPENRVRLYEIALDLLCGGWDLAKGIARGSKFGSRLKWAVLMRLATSVHGSGEKLFGELTLELGIRESLSVRTCADWWLIRDELIEDRLILRAGDQYSFPHLSFQEFLAAKDLMTDPRDERRAQILGSYLDGDDWWREVLVFYIGMCSNPIPIRNWAEAAISGDSERRRRFDELRNTAPGFYPDTA